MFQKDEFPRKKELKQIADLFNGFINSSKLACQSNGILKEGFNLLKTTKTQSEFDQILVGTLLSAFQTNDKKYHVDEYGFKEINIKVWHIKKELMDEKKVDSLGYAEPIALIGAKALIDKTLKFQGQLSSNELFESKIAKVLSNIKENYFEAYGITTNTETKVSLNN